jgi:hypothetical protein
MLRVCRLTQGSLADSLILNQLETGSCEETT